MEEKALQKHRWLLLLWIIAVSVLEPCCAKKVLRMAHVVYRHGDRTPVSTFPTDPYQESYWPDGFGRLTQKGMRMEYNIGQFLRKRYIENSNFLNFSYMHKEVYCKSSDQERCLMSAESQMAGLYPPKGWQIWNKNITWQPVPVHTVPGNEDPLIRPWDANCPRLKTLMEEKKKSAAYVEKAKQNQDFVRYIEKNSGMAQLDLSKLWKVRDPLFVEKSHGLQMPSWLTDDKWKQMNELINWGWTHLFTGGDEFSRLSGGPLLQWILLTMDAMRKGQAGMFKLNIYSGHDTTVVPFLGTLGVFNNVGPPYASAPIVEMYENTPGQFTVEIMFRNTSTQAPYPLHLPGCGYECPLDKFISLLQKRVPHDYKKACGLSQQKPSIVKKNMSLVIGLAISCGILLLILVAVLLQQSRDVLKSGHPYTSTNISDDERDVV